MLFIFGFLVFIYYRIFSSIMFDTSLSIVYCISMAILTILSLKFIEAMFGKRTILLIAKYYEQLLDETNAPKPNRQNYIFDIFLPPFAISAVANCLIGWLLVHGFSEKFVKSELCSSRYCEGGLFKFFILLIIPVVGYYAIQVYALNDRLPDN